MNTPVDGSPGSEVPPKKGLSGCVIVSLVLTGIGFVALVGFIIVGVLNVRGTDMTEPIKAMNETMKELERSVKFAGYAELQAAGCDLAIVMDTRRLDRTARQKPKAAPQVASDAAVRERQTTAVQGTGGGTEAAAHDTPKGVPQVASDAGVREQQTTPAHEASDGAEAPKSKGRVMLTCSSVARGADMDCSKLAKIYFDAATNAAAEVHVVVDDGKWTRYCSGRFGPDGTRTGEAFKDTTAESPVDKSRPQKSE